MSMVHDMFRVLYIRCHPARYPYYFHGYIPGRRREGELMVIRIAMLRLIRAGRSFAGSSKDMTNAFACTKPDRALELLANVASDIRDGELATYVCRPRRGIATARVNASDGIIDLMLEQGDDGRQKRA